MTKRQKHNKAARHNPAQPTTSHRAVRKQRKHSEQHRIKPDNCSVGYLPSTCSNEKKETHNVILIELIYALTQRQ